MLDKLTSTLDFQTKALELRADRQRNIASNIANADTPGYAARDFSFSDAMRDATGSGGGSGSGSGSSGSGSGIAMLRTGGASGDGRTDARHIPLGGTAAMGAGGGVRTDYTVQTQPTMDGNSVDLDRERAAFADNAVRYEATLRFINGQSKTLTSAITGQ